MDSGLPSSFRWTSTGPLITAKQDATHPIVSVKDPSVVFVDGRWHVFATTANTAGSWSIVYLTFTDWSQADAAPLYYLDNSPPGLRGYHAAPQVFYFAPQSKWYLIFQSGQPQYSTNDDISKPEAWTQPVNFYASEPPGVTANKGDGGWLDFFVICDDVNCHLFFTDDDGELFRSQTALGDFPGGFGDATVAIQGVKETVFEGSMTYRLKGKDAYLTLVEAFGPTGNRFFRSFVSSTPRRRVDAARRRLDEPVRGQDERDVRGRRRLDERHQPRRAGSRGLRPEAGARPEQPAVPLSGRGSDDDQHRVLADPLEAGPADADADPMTNMKYPRLLFCIFTVAWAACADSPATE